MSVYLDVEARLERGALSATARELTTTFGKLGDEISHGFGGKMSKALSAFDGTSARAEMDALAASWTRAADAEADAAARMTTAARAVESAQARAAAMIDKYGEANYRAVAATNALADAEARAALANRGHTDALVANEAAHRAHTDATVASGAAVGGLSKANALGAASLVTYTAIMVDTTKKAGDFQQSQQRLVSSAGESAQNLKTVSDGILDLAGKVGYSAQELSNGMYTVEKAGYRGADGIKVLTSAAQLAKAENADLGTVLNGLTTSMHDFGYSQDQAATVASKMNTAVGLGKTNLQEFSGALHAVEPIAAAAHISLEDVYGSLAQITQSGTSAEQGAQNMSHSISQLIKPSQQMREEMGQLGIDSRDVSEHLGQRGYAGTVQYLSDTIRQHMNPAGQVVIDTMFKSQQATDSANTMFKALPPQAQAVGQAIMNNSEAYKQFRKDRGGLTVEQANELEQWYAIEKKIDGFSNTLKTGQGDVQQYEQALALMIGGQDSLKTVLQLVGENTDSTNDKIKQIKDTTADADGTVKGFHESQETLNAKMADAKAAFGAAAIEIGSAFIPAMTEAANVAKTVGDFMAKHPAIMHEVIDTLGLLGGAWLGFKALNIVGSILTPIVGGLGAVTAAETEATTAAGGLGGALKGLAGPVAIGAAVGLPLANATLHSDPVRNSMASNPLGDNPVSRWINRNTPGFLGGDVVDADGRVTPSHANGGPLNAPGPKGKDSALFWGASGEHVLTADDVDAMGGHAGVHQFRNALHRAVGGAVGPDVSAAESMAGTPYSQANRNDCSGMVGRVVESATGIGGGLPTTQNMGQFLQAHGFQPGIGGPGTISVGWYNHGSGANDGHTAMTLSDGENAESGGSHGNFLIGGGAAGASSSQFDHHMFLPNIYGEGEGGSGGGFGGGSRGGGGGMGGFGSGGGVPAGSTAGRGPGGEAGYYTPNPEKVTHAQEQLRHLDAEIATAEERKAHLKSDATQAQKDRLDEEIRHLKAERAEDEGRLQKAQQGDFHKSSGGRGGGKSGDPFLPVALDDKFGLDKGLPGVTTWLVGWLEDLVLGPMETKAMADMNGGGGEPGSEAGRPGGGLGSPGGGFGIGGNGVPGGASTAGDLGRDSGAPSSTGGGYSGGGGSPAGSSGGSESGSGSDSLNGRLRWGGGKWRGSPGPIPGMDMVSAPGGQRRDQNFYKLWQSGVIDADGNTIVNSGMPPGLQQTLSGASRGGQFPVSEPPPLGTSALPGLLLPGTPPDTSLLAPTGGPGTRGDITGGRPFGPTSGALPQQLTPPLAAQHHSKGGPSGTDTIPSWLSPDEFVEQKSAVDKYGMGFMDAINRGDIDPASVQYHEPGGPTTPPPPAPAPALPPAGPQNLAPQNAGTPKPGPAQQPPGLHLPGSGGAQGPGPKSAVQDMFGPPGSAPTGPTAAGSGLDVHEDLSKLPTPGAGDQRPGAGLPASPGLGISGGLIGAVEGAAESAASTAGNAFAPGAGSAASGAMQLGFQELNRAASAGAQAAGVGVEGILETIIPDSSGTGGDWMKTIPGRLLSGVAGARPAGQNTAGQTTPSVAGGGQSAQYSGFGQQGPANGGMHIENLHVQADNSDQLRDSLNSEHSMASGMYTNSGLGAGLTQR